jgi:hypothetical protein
MRTHDRVRLALSTGAAGLLLTGCANTAGAAHVASEGDARQDLMASIDAVRQGNYAFLVKGNKTYSGVVHLPQSALIEHADPGQPRATTLNIGDQRYVKYLMYGEKAPSVRAEIELALKKNMIEAKDIPATKARLRAMDTFDGKRWVHVDPARMRTLKPRVLDPGPTVQHPDATPLTALVEAVTTAKRNGNVIAGALDASKVNITEDDVNGDPFGVDLGDKGSAVPFTAELDQQGRLTRFTANVPPVPQSDEASADPTGAGQGIPETPAFSIVISIMSPGAAPVQKAPATAATIELAGDLYPQIPASVD